MIFELGRRSINLSCPGCGRKHFNFQIGEESLACACGVVCALVNVEQDGSTYSVFSKKKTQEMAQELFDSEPRIWN